MKNHRNPLRVIDNDKGEVTVSIANTSTDKLKELRGWSYKNDDERRTKMLCAREYVEGFCDGVKWCDGIDAAEWRKL